MNFDERNRNKQKNTGRRPRPVSQRPQNIVHNEYEQMPLRPRRAPRRNEHLENESIALAERAVRSNNRDRRENYAHSTEYARDPYAERQRGQAPRRRPPRERYLSERERDLYSSDPYAPRKRARVGATSPRRSNQYNQYDPYAEPVRKTARPDYVYDDEFADYELEAMREVRKGRFTTIILYIITALLVVGTAYSTYLMMRYNVLPTTYRMVVIGVCAFITLVTLGCACYARYSTPVRRTGLTIGTLGLIVLCFVTYILNGVLGTLFNITSDKTITTEMQVLVLKDSVYQSLQDVVGHDVYAPQQQDQKNIEDLLQNIKKEEGVDLNIVDSGTYVEGVNKLYNHQADVIVFKSSYKPNIIDEHPKFEKETRVLYSYKNEEEHTTHVAKNVDTANEPFVFYVSGIDTYGDIETVSRSDVNLVLAVNPKTHKILITNVPRDTYLPIAGGGNNEGDKLTHAGIYGVNSSVQTLENFLDVPINYYGRVNFTSVLELVDALGGVTVDNPREFSSHLGYSFPAGEITLNGEEALVFSRERYNLQDGDSDRGKNQQRVLTGIIRKLTSPAILTNFPTVLSVVDNNMETNMPVDDMMKLVNKQISNGGDWDIESNSITGEGSIGRFPSAAMPGYELYMFEADQNSVNEAKAKIKAVLGE